MIGQLHQACKVVRPGRMFLSRMIDLSTEAKEMHHHLCLNAAFRSKFQWWATFLFEWDGVSMSRGGISCDPRVCACLHNNYVYAYMHVHMHHKCVR